MSTRARIWIGAMAALAAVTMVAIVVANQSFSPAPAQAQKPAPAQKPQLATFLYSVKFVCGSILSEPLEANSQRAANEPPVKSGNYATAINIHNFSDAEVDITTQAAIASIVPGTSDHPVSGQSPDITLEAGQALEIDCPQIMGSFADAAGAPHPDALASLR